MGGRHAYVVVLLLAVTKLLACKLIQTKRMLWRVSAGIVIGIIGSALLQRFCAHDGHQNGHGGDQQNLHTRHDKHETIIYCDNQRPNQMN